MDPDAALEEARQAADDYQDAESYGAGEEAASRLIESFRALDVWLTNGGFLPEAWAGSRPTQVEASS